MSSVLTDWLAWYASSDPSPQTLRLRRYQLARFAERHPDLLAVTTEDLSRWLGRPGWSTETRRSQLAALRSLYGWAHASGRVERDPSRLLPRIRPAQHQPRPAPDRVVDAAA